MALSIRSNPFPARKIQGAGGIGPAVARKEKEAGHRPASFFQYDFFSTGLRLIDQPVVQIDRCDGMAIAPSILD